MSEAVNRVHHTTGSWHANKSLDGDCEESINIPNEGIGQDNNHRTAKLEHRGINIENHPEWEREGYAKSEGFVINSSSYAKF